MIETFAHRLAQKLISLSTKNTVTKDDIAVVEKAAKMEGRSMSMVLTEKR